MVDVRNAGLEDIEKILRHQKGKNFLISMHSGPDIWARSQNDLANAVRGYNLLVAEEGGSLLGYLMLSESKGIWEIKHLNVHKDRQGTGVGTRLVEAAVKKLKKRKAPVVEAAADVLAGNFWGRRGFKEVGKRRYRRVI